MSSWAYQPLPAAQGPPPTTPKSGTDSGVASEAVVVVVVISTTDVATDSEAFVEIAALPGTDASTSVTESVSGTSAISTSDTGAASDSQSVIKPVSSYAFTMRQSKVRSTDSLRSGVSAPILKSSSDSGAATDTQSCSYQISGVDQSPRNLVANSDYESGLSGISWYGPAGGSNTYVWDQTQGNTGSKSFRATTDGGGSNGPKPAQISTVSGQRYMASLWIKPDVTETFRFLIEGESGVFVDFTSVPSGVWTKLTVSWTATVSLVNLVILNFSGSVRSFNIDTVEAYGTAETAKVGISGSDSNLPTAETIGSRTLTQDDANNPVIVFGATPHQASGSGIGNLAGNTKLAQSFQYGSNFKISDLQLRLFRSGSPADNLVIEIQTDSAGSPSGTVLGTHSIVASTISPVDSWVSVAGGTIAGLSLNAGTPYWIVLSRSGAITGACILAYDSPTAYVDGVGKKWNGSVWTGPNASDMAFQVAISSESASVSVGATPISGTDASGSVTESASVTVNYITMDTNGAATEAVALVSVALTADSETTTDNTSLVARLQFSEFAGIDEFASVSTVNQISDTDTGAASDTATVTKVVLTAPDTNGATTESASTNVTTFISGNDANSTTSEIISLVASATTADANGATTEATGTRLTGTDANSATTENVLMARQVVDEGGATDTQSAPRVFVNVNDFNGATTDTASIVSPVFVTDQNFTTENATLVAKVTATDANGVAGENAGTGTIKSDTDANGLTTEAASPNFITIVTDVNGVVTEAQVEIYRASSTDTGLGTDIGSVATPTLIVGTDSGTATENASTRYFASGGMDTLSGAENASPRFLAAVTDVSGATTEAVSVLRAYLVADSGTATDSAAVTFIGISDSDYGLFAVEFGRVGGMPIEVGLPVDMEHALIGANPNESEITGVNGLDGSTVLSANGSKARIVVHSSLGTATLIGVK